MSGTQHEYQYPDEDCPDCGSDEFTPLWYGLGGVEDYKGARCDGCKTDYVRSERGSDEVKALSEVA